MRCNIRFEPGEQDMDPITITLAVAVAVIAAGRAVEIASKRPDAFAAMFEGARSFAESALRESASMASEPAQQPRRTGADEAAATERYEEPALAA